MKADLPPAARAIAQRLGELDEREAEEFLDRILMQLARKMVPELAAQMEGRLDPEAATGAAALMVMDKLGELRDLVRRMRALPRTAPEGRA
jgi:hypothetical protein